MRTWHPEEVKCAHTQKSWVWWFIHQAPRPEELRKFLEFCEFRRGTVLSAWQDPGGDREADAEKPAEGARGTEASEAPTGSRVELVAADTHAPATAKLPRFNTKTAKALLAAKKVCGDWASPPTEDDSRAFLLANFNGVPNDPHRRIRRDVARPDKDRAETEAQHGGIGGNKPL